MTIDSNPSGARCELVRQGRVVGSVDSTPGAVMLEKTKHDIDVVCRKGGYAESKAFADSGSDSAVFGNIILGGPIGWGIDSIVGADNRYPDVVTVNLVSGNSPSYSDSPSSQPANLASGESIKKLETLKALKDSGILTEKEYQQKRAEVVKNL